jgi:hypothetical protein
VFGSVIAVDGVPDAEGVDVLVADVLPVVAAAAVLAVDLPLVAVAPPLTVVVADGAGGVVTGGVVAAGGEQRGCARATEQTQRLAA